MVKQKQPEQGKEDRVPGWTAFTTLGLQKSTKYTKYYYKYGPGQRFYFAPRLAPQLHACDFVCEPCRTCRAERGGYQSPYCQHVCQLCWSCDPAPHDNDYFIG